MACPVHRNSWAGPWLICGVETACRNDTLSTTRASCGSRSDSQAPDCPCRAKANGDASRRGVPLMKAKRSPLARLGGRGWPSLACSFGFGVNRSSCEGPPAMVRQMTWRARARGRACTGRSSSASASAPMPAPVWASRARRPRARRSSSAGVTGDEPPAAARPVPDTAGPATAPAGPDGHRAVAAGARIDRWDTPAADSRARLPSKPFQRTARGPGPSDRSWRSCSATCRLARTCAAAALAPTTVKFTSSSSASPAADTVCGTLKGFRSIQASRPAGSSHSWGTYRAHHSAGLQNAVASTSAAPASSGIGNSMLSRRWPRTMARTASRTALNSGPKPPRRRSASASACSSCRSTVNGSFITGAWLSLLDRASRPTARRTGRL